MTAWDPVVDQLPAVNARRLALHVTPAAERALRAGHPWLFAEAIRRQSHAGTTGDLAVIYDHKNRFLAIGLYDAASPVRVKILQHHQPVLLDAAWFAARIQAAAARRDPLAAAGTTGYRLLHGENDGLPGLIVDRYAATLVIKLYTAAWLPHLRLIIPALQALGYANGLLRLSRQLGQAAPHGLHDGLTLWGEVPGEQRFAENGLRFAADLHQGHKTGFFFDHRENRARVREYAAGRRVLDVFAYAGAFSLYAAAGGAREVTSLDISAPALRAAEANFALNRAVPGVAAARHIALVGDVFDVLPHLAASGQQYDCLIIDPPTFTANSEHASAALDAYRRLLRLALPLLAPGGLLVMASCSSRVPAEDFFRTIRHTAQQAGWRITELARTGHALDHPITFPEGAYLKCLFALMEGR